jgi:hypothetical protein
MEKGGPCTRCRQGRQEVVLAFDSGQAPLRHPRGPAESCFLPDLTRFTGSRCAGPDPQRLVRVVPLGGPSLERGFSPPDVGLGYRAPRAPRLARSTGEATRPRVPSCPLEGCESGRIGTLGKRVWGNSPWVRIPLPPPTRRCAHPPRAPRRRGGQRSFFPSLSPSVSGATRLGWRAPAERRAYPGWSVCPGRSVSPASRGSSAFQDRSGSREWSGFPRVGWEFHRYRSPASCSRSVG